jgi:hypothetical protein
MARGIERTKIFRNHKDREDFLCRLGERARAGAWVVYAWALMPNHIHLLVRTGLQPLSTNMRKLMTGHVVNFNRRHKLPMASDEGILGSGEFIEEVLSQAEKRLEGTLCLKARKVELGILASRVSRSEGTDWDLVRSWSRVGKVVKTRRLFCQLAVKKFGYSGAEVARYLGTTTSSVTRLANLRKCLTSATRIMQFRTYVPYSLVPYSLFWFFGGRGGGKILRTIGALE